jgi:hypothetical protein
MEQKLENTVALLERTPRVLNALLRGLPEEWTERNEGEGTWTVYEVMKHLVKAEGQNWVPRARMILEVGEARAFPVFERVAEGVEKKSMEMLLDEFAGARAENLETVRGWGLTQSDLTKRGLHPTFGAVTLGELLATWAAHDLTHLHQISRVMAVQYKEAVGPWVAFLGVMRCAGHSD